MRHEVSVTFLFVLTVLMVVHNIGRGPQMEDVLFSWKITGHYRYFGPAH